MGRRVDMIDFMKAWSVGMLPIRRESVRLWYGGSNHSDRRSLLFIDTSLFPRI